MKRRNFINNTLIGSGGLLAGFGCTPGVTEEKAQAVQTVNAPVKISQLAPKPPLGWNSFDSYGVYLHEEAALANMEALAQKLKPFGYEYFVIDLGWYGEYKLIPGTLYPDEKHASDLALDDYGLLEGSKTYFPNGIKPLADKAHELGLQFGVHMMRGIPRKAVEQNLPIKGTNHKASEIADQSSICVWCHHNYGIDMSKPGAQEYYNSAYQKLADWGVDFVKVDDLIPYPKEIEAIARAIEKTGRPMVYSLSPGGTTNLKDLPYYRRSNMVRITADIWDREDDLAKAFKAWRTWQGIGTPGFWPDLDMIPFGNLQMMQPAEYGGQERDVRLSGHGYKRVSQLSKPGMRTFLTIRALAASPLMIGGDLPTLDDYSLSLLTNSEMLACDQNGHNGTLLREHDGIEVWVTPKVGLHQEGWMGIFNRNEEKKTVAFNKKDLALVSWYDEDRPERMIVNPNPFEFRDIWNDTTFTFENEHSFEIDGHDVAFLKYRELMKS